MKILILQIFIICAFTGCNQSQREEFKDPRPSDEIEYSNTIAKYNNDYISAGNDIVAGRVRDQGMDFLHRQITVSNWAGQIYKVNANGWIDLTPKIYFYITEEK